MGYPNTCQPRSEHPFLPIYHVIGNVTTNADGEMTNLESINDVSSVIQYKVRQARTKISAEQLISAEPSN